MMTGGVRTVARRYARAVLDVALATPAKGQGPAEVGQALAGARALLESHPELARTLAHPALPAEARKKVATAVFKDAPAVVGRLVALLVERDRVGILGAIEDAYVAAWNEHRGAVRAEAVTATPLAEAQTEALRRAFEKATGKDVEVVARVDAEVLGGLKVFLAGRTYDGTVKAQLEAMRRTLLGNG
jgi:F-type H+-transporting ATPase subunit delta